MIKFFRKIRQHSLLNQTDSILNLINSELKK